MPSLAKLIRSFALLCGLAGAGFATSVQAQSTVCGIDGSASATPVVYDPFNPTGLANANITLNLTRHNPPGGSQTSIVNFYLQADSATGTAANGTQIVPLSVAGQATINGVGLNIFYDFNAFPPTLTPITITPSGSNRFLKINFTGNNAGSDTVQVTFQVTLPPNLNLQAVQSLAFNVNYSCYMQGGSYNKQTASGSIPDAVVFPVTVLSALRTYYAGTALDFGEIGNVTQNPADYSTHKTNPANHVFVQSSGAYSVTLSSANGFKLFKPGATVDNDKIRYSLRFLGQTVDSTTNPSPNTTAINVSCQRATLTTTGNSLPIQATLQEGGSGKNPSPTYSDTLTITVTPLIYSDPGINACGSIPL